MDIFQALRDFISGGQPKKQPIQNGQVRTQQQIQTAPFKMYEDNSFQGNPTQFQASNPNYKFYEDNTFSKQPPLSRYAQSGIAGLQALSNFNPRVPTAPSFGSQDQWDVNSPDSIYPPSDPRSKSTFRY